MILKHTLLAALALSAFGCSSDGNDSGSQKSSQKTDAQYEQELGSSMHDALLDDVQALHDAAVALQKAAPEPSGRGWDADLDADALDTMKSKWIDARTAYERTEGALAPLFPDIDTEIDARYDDFLGMLPDGDSDLFDDQGVTGMHAIERILYVKTTPDAVVQFEQTLPGYVAAAWPATEDEAKEFKEKLAQRLVTDTGTLQDQWSVQKIDLDGAYAGLIDLMLEQREKVAKAATQEEESRYSQRTMADIRDNLAGTRKVYDLFESWLDSKKNGKSIDLAVQAGFDNLNTIYGTVQGDAIPQPPSDWSSENPTADNLATPFGKLYSAVNDAVDPNKDGSVVDGMTKTAEAVGLMVSQ
ncbi:MAG TPA: EfeM/EfeO family lipoprotein [Polyangiaceae bacterium]|nr:EfeM/EfeO family lipoprotein [Polyangiaceae bacterium]